MRLNEGLTEIEKSEAALVELMFEIHDGQSDRWTVDPIVIDDKQLLRLTYKDKNLFNSFVKDVGRKYYSGYYDSCIDVQWDKVVEIDSDTLTIWFYPGFAMIDDYNHNFHI